MSWSFEFMARDKATALKVAELMHMPENVRQFLKIAITNMNDDTQVYGYHEFKDVTKIDKAIYVKSSGHLCDGPGSSEFSSNTTEIKWVALHNLIA